MMMTPEPAFSVEKGAVLGYIHRKCSVVFIGEGYRAEYLVHMVDQLDVWANRPTAHVGNAGSILTFCISFLALFLLPAAPSLHSDHWGDTQLTPRALVCICLGIPKNQ
jgi:hypothetical protein